jgi:hypothetical protein
MQKSNKLWGQLSFKKREKLQYEVICDQTFETSNKKLLIMESQRDAEISCEKINQEMRTFIPISAVKMELNKISLLKVYQI